MKVVRSALALCTVAMLASALAIFAASPDAAAQNELIENGSFEMGLTGWGVVDLASPFRPVGVFADSDPARCAGGFGFTPPSAADGVQVLTHGFDGGGPGTIEVFQDVTIPASGTPVLTGSVWAQWDLSFGVGAVQDRVFEVVIEPAGGGAPLQQTTIFSTDSATAPIDGFSGDISVDLSAFKGQTIRINFVTTIPENFTGPACLQLDSISLSAQASGYLETSVPICIEDSRIVDNPDADALGAGDLIRIDGRLYHIVSGDPGCEFNCVMGFDVNCDGTLHDYCPIENDRDEVAGAKVCLALIAAESGDVTEPSSYTPDQPEAASVVVSVPAAQAIELAHTGSESRTLGYLGAGLLGFGAFATASARRFRRESNQS